MENKLANAILNKVRGVGFLDQNEEEVLLASDYFKLQLVKNNIPEFPTFIQYEKFYLTLSFELLQAVHAAQKLTCDGLLEGRLNTIQALEIQVEKQATPTPGTPGILDPIYEANWSYWVQSEDGSFKEPIDDLECIYIWIRQQEIKK